MKTTLTVGRKQIHSNWMLMGAFFEVDGTCVLTLADKLSNDKIRLQMTKEELNQLKERLTKTERP